MASVPLPVDDRFGSLSLIGQLSLQEKKDKKDRKGRITFKKKINYWFWFDEKECCLKYYKKSETYYTDLHRYEGLIDLRDAKISPSEVYLDSVGSLSIDPDVVSNRTFIVITPLKMYALTADKDVSCHQWIKKLQEKRAIWDKKVQFKSRRNQSSKELTKRTVKEEGLVNNPDLHTSTSSSHVRRMFGDILGSGQFINRVESCPQSLSEIPIQSPTPEHHQLTVSPPIPISGSRIASRLAVTHSGRITSSQSCGNIVSGNDDIDSDGTATIVKDEMSAYIDGILQNENPEDLMNSKLTDTERWLVKLYIDLVEARQENERLLQKVTYLEDEQQKQFNQKLQLINEVQELMETVHKLKADQPVQNLQNENESLKDVIKQLKRSLGSVDGEIELYKSKLEERDKRMNEIYKSQRELEDSLLYFKAKYVSLLDWSFKVPTPGPGGLVSDDSDPIEEKLKEDLLNLIKHESSVDNPLVDISGGNQSVFEDQYGEIHDWNNDSNICHFLCRQLYLHYTQYDLDSNMQEWYNYAAKSLKTNKDGHWEIPSETFRPKRRELRGYLRRGVPQPMRSAMWTSLVYSYVGRMRDVLNSTAQGHNYYQSVVQQPSPYKKQIQLDQYRTMPSNKHFKPGGKGSKKLENVLIAYSNHNKNVGYCQGMNMIVAAALLYLDEESTFWYLVAVIEKLMPIHYYTNGLAAAQADQAVMKSLVEEKLPHISNTLEDSGIDVTVVTFNWFLTLFIDALPTESMLRVMDCFLLEGRKVFFRFSLAILKIHERRLMELHDPVKIFQFIKEVAKHIFNVEELFKVAFTELEPFPSRSLINSRCKPHLEKFLADWKERETRKKEAASSQLSNDTSINSAKSSLPPPTSYLPVKQKKILQWECGSIISKDEVWLCCGERQTGKICIVRNGEDGLHVNSPRLNVGSKILCIKQLADDVVMVGTLDFFVHAISIQSRTEIWSMKMNDTVLDFVSYKNNIIFALADGYIAAITTATPDMTTPPPSDPILYRMGNTAVQCMAITPFNQVWVGCGKSITILEAETYDPVEAVVIPDKAGKIYKMEPSEKGIWVTFKNSSMLYLYDYVHHIQILAVDYTTLFPSKKENLLHKSSFENRITVVMVRDNTLWIGSGCGFCHVFKISSLVDEPQEKIQQLANVKSRSLSHLNDRRVSQSLKITKEDSSLIGNKDMGLSLAVHEPPPSPNMSTTGTDEDQTNKIDNAQENESRFSRQKSFGRTFHRHIKREATHVDLKQRDNTIYKLDHVWTGNNVLIENDCSKITVIQPLVRKERVFVITCLSSTTRTEHAVLLWQPDGKEPPSWSCKLMDECYSFVSKQDPPTISRPRPVERGRSYSSILGSYSQDDTFATSSTWIPTNTETLVEADSDIDY